MKYRETIDGMMKLGEVTAQLKELEVALDSAKLSRQQAETECTLAKQKAEESSLEAKRLKLMVSIYIGTPFSSSLSLYRVRK